VQGSGTFTPATDATYDIGYTGLRARDIYASRQILSNANAGASLAAYAFVGDADTGVFRSNPDVLELAAGGANIVTIGRSGNDQNFNIGSNLVGNIGIELGQNRSGTGSINMDFHTDSDIFTDYGFRIIRGAGASGATQFFHRGIERLELVTQDAGAIVFSTSNSQRWNVGATGVFAPSADNTYDLGSSSNRSRDIYAARAINVGATGSSYALQAAPTGISFFAAALKAKPTITGSRGGGSATAQLLTQLAQYGLITDNSVA
jgi:hypothetical protein